VGVAEQPDEQPPPEELAVGVAVAVAVAVGVAVGVHVVVGVELEVGWVVGDVPACVAGGAVVGAEVAFVGDGVALAVGVASREGDDVVWPVFTVCVPPVDLVIAVATPATIASAATEAATTSSHRFRSGPRRPGAGPWSTLVAAVPALPEPAAHGPVAAAPAGFMAAVACVPPVQAGGPLSTVGSGITGAGVTSPRVPGPPLAGSVPGAGYPAGAGGVASRRLALC